MAAVYKVGDHPLLTSLQNPDELKYDFLHGMPSPWTFLIENKILTAVSYLRQVPVRICVIISLPVFCFCV